MSYSALLERAVEGKLCSRNYCAPPIQGCWSSLPCLALIDNFTTWRQRWTRGTYFGHAVIRACRAQGGAVVTRVSRVECWVLGDPQYDHDKEIMALITTTASRRSVLVPNLLRFVIHNIDVAKVFFSEVERFKELAERALT